MLQIP